MRISWLAVVSLLALSPMETRGDVAADARRLEMDLRQLSASAEMAANADLDKLNAEFDLSLRRAAASGETDVAKLEALRGLLQNLSLLRSGQITSIPHASPGASTPVERWRAGSGDGSICQNPVAISIDSTRQIEMAAAGQAGSEWWFTVDAPSEAAAIVSTVQSPGDSEIAAFRNCGDQTPLAVNDDFYGLSAQLALTDLDNAILRLRNIDSTRPNAFQLRATTSMGFSGQVTSLVPVSGVQVAAYLQVGQQYTFAGQVQIVPPGAYTMPLSTAGIYGARTTGFTSGYVPEAYQNVACNSPNSSITDCPGFANISVTLNSSVPGIDFSLDPSKSLAVHVFDINQQPILNASGSLFTNNGFFGSASTQNGRLIHNNLRSGVIYRARASASGYTTTAFDGVPCDSTCTDLTGNPISFAPDEYFKTINIYLPQSRALVVRMNRIGSFQSVALRYASGQIAQSAQAFGTGSTVEMVLAPPPAGSYYLTAESNGSFATLFPNIQCASDCLAELAQGTLVNIPSTGPLPTIDLILNPYPSISGSVLEIGSSLPVTGSVNLLTPSQPWPIQTVSIQPTGDYAIPNVRPGQYILVASSQQHVDVGYPNAPCSVSISGNIVCPNATLLTLGPTGLEDIDFTLQRSASVRGRVTLEGLPTSVDFSVRARRADSSFVSGIFTRSGSNYQLLDLPDGEFSLGVFANSNSPFYSQVHPGLDCVGNCNSTPGALIGLLPGGSVNIDFDLALARGVLGYLLDASTGLPIVSRGIDVWSSGSSVVTASVLSAPDGKFVIPIGFFENATLCVNIPPTLLL